MGFHAMFQTICVLLAVLGAGPAHAGDPATLKEAAGDRLLIGAAAGSDLLKSPEIGDLVASQFACLTAGNEMKPDYLQRVKGRFTFETADRIAQFTQDNGLQLIGHTLCWHQQTPKWMFEDEHGQPLSREAALANLREHIHTVVTHFKGKVKGWDVVNEAISDDPKEYLRDTPARRAIGDDYVLKAFEFAHEADPDVELYYNDYNIDFDYKRDRALRLVREIKAAGLRIDGVGIQGHYLLKKPDLAEIERGIRAWSNEGLDVMVTELDVDPLPRRKGSVGADLDAIERAGLDPYKEGLPDAVQAELAERYGSIVSLLLRYPQVTRITFWGVTDGGTWLNDFPVRGRTNHPMLWDRQLQPKPAFDAVIRALKSYKPEPESETQAGLHSTVQP